MDHKKSSWEDTAAKLRAAVQDREPGGGDHYLRPQRNQHFRDLPPAGFFLPKLRLQGQIRPVQILSGTTSQFSDKFLHLEFEKALPLRGLLAMMETGM